MIIDQFILIKLYLDWLPLKHHKQLNDINLFCKIILFIQHLMINLKSRNNLIRQYYLFYLKLLMLIWIFMEFKVIILLLHHHLFILILIILLILQSIYFIINVRSYLKLQFIIIINLKHMVLVILIMLLIIL